MFNEIEESVCFLITFMHGKVPRSRIESFAEILCNLLTDEIYKNGTPLNSYQLNIKGNQSDPIIFKAAEESFIHNSELLSFFPKSLKIELKIGGDVKGFGEAADGEKQIYPARNGFNVSCTSVVSSNFRRPIFQVEKVAVKIDDVAYDKPTFEVDRSSQVFTSQVFAGTRFGSTKWKTNQNSKCFDGSASQHPFTMPSVYAYLRLLVFLNATACAAMIDDEDLVDPLKKTEADDGCGDLVSSGFVDDEGLSDGYTGVDGWDLD